MLVTLLLSDSDHYDKENSGSVHSEVDKDCNIFSNISILRSIGNTTDAASTTTIITTTVDIAINEDPPHYRVHLQ